MFNLQHNPGDREERKGPDPLSVIYLIVAGHVACLTPFMRRSFGTEAFRVHGPAAAVMIVMYGAMTGEWAMWPFFCVWVVMLLFQRILTAIDYRRGVVQHSRYSGYPSLAFTLCRFVKKEVTAKGIVEPMICMLVGSAILPLNQYLGFFIMLGMLSFMMKLSIERTVNRARLRTMRDGHIEQRHLADAFRGNSDDY